MSAVATSPSNTSIRRVDLLDRCPPGGAAPGGFQAVLYGSLPAMEVTAPMQSLRELEQVIRHAVESEDAQYVLLDLDVQQPPYEIPATLGGLSSQLKAIGCRLIPYQAGRPISLNQSVFPNRETAIEECLRDWEAKLLLGFSW